MRLDKFLKYSGIMKRRTVAKRICDSGHCAINGKKAKPSNEVQPASTMAQTSHF